MIRSPAASPGLKPRAAPPPDDSDSDSTLSTLEGESSAEILQQLREQLEQLQMSSGDIRHQVRGVFRRARTETTDWMNTPLQPRTPAVRRWVRRAGLADKPTLSQFIPALFAATEGMDLGSRRLYFTAADAEALWEGKRVVTIFEVIAGLPRLFV